MMVELLAIFEGMNNEYELGGVVFQPRFYSRKYFPETHIKIVHTIRGQKHFL